MRIILSPAKKMREDYSLNYPLSTPIYINKSQQLLHFLKSLSYDELKELFQCNDKIAKLNFERYEVMNLENFQTPALLSYDGIAFQYMAPQIFTEDYFFYVEKHLRILSGFYGVLKPFDGVVPYRLEMQAKLKAPFASNLYQFWGKDLYEQVVDDSHIILNLASKEYSKIIKKYITKEDVWIDVIFGQWINGKIVEKGVYVKMARGEMVRYMAENNVEDIEKIKDFNRLGFSFREDLSTANQWAFIKKS